MTTAPFSGVGVALVTLFDDDGELDAAATGDLAAQLVGLGVRAVVVGGSTGEASALDAAERRALVAAVRAAVGSGTPVVAGVGAATGRQAVVYTRDAIDAGADAVLALSPPRVDDPRAYYETLAEAAGEVPLLAYHFPRVSAPGITVDTLAELPIAGVKDSSADPERLLIELDRFDGAIYVGSAVLLAMAGAVGADGAILTVANHAPELCLEAFAGDGAAQRALLDTHLRSRPFPSGLKNLVAERFGTSTATRIGR